MPSPPPEPPASPAGQAAAAPERPRSGVRHSVRALHHRDYALFWTAALVSNTGSWLQNITVPFVLFHLTGRATWVGLATFCQFIPTMLLGPLGGSVADRFDRGRVLLVTQSLMAVAAFGMWAAWEHWKSPVWILALVAVAGIVTGVNQPSWQAFVPSLVPRADLLSAISLNSLQFNAARALGPAVAGVTLAWLGVGWSFLLNAVSFGFVIAALLVMRTPAAPRHRHEGGVMAQFALAVRYIRTEPGLRIALLIPVFVAFLGNPITQFTVIYANTVYHVNETMFGLLGAGLGLGAIIAAPLVSGWDAYVSRATIVRWSVPAYGLGIAVFGLSTQYWLGLVALVFVGAGFLAIVTVTNTACQLIVSEDMRGRVMAARIMTFTGAYPIGGLLQGWLADVWGPRPTVTAAGLGIVVVAGVLLRQRSLLARLDDEPALALAPA